MDRFNKILTDTRVHSNMEYNDFLGIGKGKGFLGLGKQGGFLGTGLGSGARKTCKDAGLSGAEKSACAKQLRASGWKSGDPIPADMLGLSEDDLSTTDDTTTNDIPVKDTSNNKNTNVNAQDDTKKVLTYSAIGIASIAGVSLLIWGIITAIKK